MKIFALALFLASAAHATDELPFVENAYSEIEGHLDDAQEALISAQTYICRDLAERGNFSSARRSYDKVDRRYRETGASAQVLLGRKLNLQVWVNSCRRYDDAKFRALLRSANKSIQQAKGLIEKGEIT